VVIEPITNNSTMVLEPITNILSRQRGNHDGEREETMMGKERKP
jgi:hypothetical protein